MLKYFRKLLVDWFNKTKNKIMDHISLTKKYHAENIKDSIESTQSKIKIELKDADDPVVIFAYNSVLENLSVQIKSIDQVIQILKDKE